MIIRSYEFPQINLKLTNEFLATEIIKRNSRISIVNLDKKLLLLFKKVI